MGTMLCPLLTSSNESMPCCLPVILTVAHIPLTRDSKALNRATSAGAGLPLLSAWQGQQDPKGPLSYQVGS